VIGESALEKDPELLCKNFSARGLAVLDALF
jgi:hypothetical protein